ncbi:hypothetical protein B0H66DRAFT_458050, partial [Apodospora peruviana]
AAAWGRAEFQSKLVAPWARLLRGPAVSSDRILLLDYLSDFQPYSVFHAARNKDFVVAITSAVSIMIRLLIVISTGLITLSWTAVTYESYPFYAQDQIVSDSSRLVGAEPSIVWHMMMGLAEQNLTYPEGMSKDYAFQSVAPAEGLPSTSESRYTVDALENSLECHSAEVVLRGAAPHELHYDDQTLNITVTSQDCHVELVRLAGPIPAGWQDRSCDNCSTAVFARFEPNVRCDDTTGDDGRRILVMFGELSYTWDYSLGLKDYTGQNHRRNYFGVLHKSAQLLCVPKLTVGTVDVVRNGSHISSVTPAHTFDKTLDFVNDWDIVDAQLQGIEKALVQTQNPAYDDPYVTLWGTTVDTDNRMAVALPFGHAGAGPVTALYDTDTLQRLAVFFYRQSAAIIAKRTLMEPVASRIETKGGSAIVSRDRLVVRAWAAQSMAGIIGACIILTLIALIMVSTPRGSSVWLPCNPAGIFGVASLVLHSRDLTTGLRGLGAADDKSLERVLQGRVFEAKAVHDRFAVLETAHNGSNIATRLTCPQISSARAEPVIVHPFTRSAVCLALGGIVVALELMLRKSIRETGLGDVGEDTYIHYTWTTIPAVVLGLLAMVLSAMDFRVRSLAPYIVLERPRGITTSVFMSLEFLDMSVPRVIYRELRLADIGALAATVALLVSSLFTIFSASLFQTLSLSATGSLTLRTKQSFEPHIFDSLGASEPYTSGATKIESLILEGNLSYPRFTYEDLAFPEFLPEDISMPDQHFNESAVSIEAVIPAVRANLECRSYNSSHIYANFTFPHMPDIGIEGESCGGYNEELVWWSEVYPNTTYIARARPVTPAHHQCSDLVFFWVKLDTTPTTFPTVFTHARALGCNVTISAVEVEVVFSGLNLDFDTAQHPRDGAIIRDSVIEGMFDPYDLYDGLIDASPGIAHDPDDLDPFFGALTTSPWAVPRSSLGDLAADDAVEEAIKFQLRIIIAQTLAARRLPANTTNTTLADPKP